MDNNNGGTTQLTRVERIEAKIDRGIANDIAVSTAAGGIKFATMADALEMAKLMAISDVAVPKYLRGNVGACLAICIQAVEWRMSPFAVANKSYPVNDRISYESQLVHAVVETRAPLVGRLRCSYSGEGLKRRCKVWGTLKGEDKPFEYESPPFDMIQPKNSPLWKTKPDLQLFYNTSRDWARMYVPDVLLNVYAEDELETSIVPSRPAVQMPRAIGEAPPQQTVTVEDPDAQPPAPEEPSMQQEPEVEPEAEPPPAEPTGFEKYKIELWEIADGLGCPREKFDETLGRWVLALKAKGKEDSIPPQKLSEMADALANRAGVWVFLK